MWEQVSKPALLGNAEGYSEAYVAIVEAHFTSITSTMLTLVGFMFVDSAMSIYLPLILERYELALIFFSFLLIVSVTESARACRYSLVRRYRSFKLFAVPIWADGVPVLALLVLESSCLPARAHPR